MGELIRRNAKLWDVQVSIYTIVLHQPITGDSSHLKHFSSKATKDFQNWNQKIRIPSEYCYYEPEEVLTIKTSFVTPELQTRSFYIGLKNWCTKYAVGYPITLITDLTEFTPELEKIAKRFNVRIILCSQKD